MPSLTSRAKRLRPVGGIESDYGQLVTEHTLVDEEASPVVDEEVVQGAVDEEPKVPFPQGDEVPVHPEKGRIGGDRVGLAGPAERMRGLVLVLEIAPPEKAVEAASGIRVGAAFATILSSLQVRGGHR